MAESRVEVRVISIGCLAAHPLWGERSAVRTGHSTTTLVRCGNATILVDPGLPEQAVAARLHERSGLKPSDITHVFLTSFNPECRRGLRAFEKAQWLIAEAEREAIGVAMVQRLQAMDADDDASVRELLEQDIALLQRCIATPDTIASSKGQKIDAFPLGGVTPGLCGVVVPMRAGGGTGTTLICGDAVPTVEHLERGQVLTPAADVERARESFAEALELADVVVCGRDNWAVVPVKRGF